MDEDGKTCFLIQEQLRGYKNEDGKRKKQKALPLSVLRKMKNLASTTLEEACSWLLIGALFFAMRSCEYIKTSPTESSKRTKIVRLRNIKFKKGSSIVPHSSSQIHSADLVLITFKFQKNQKKFQTVHMFNSGDKILNPVIAWAHTVTRLRSTIPNCSGDTKVCEFWSGSKIIEISSSQVRAHLRSIVELMGEASLGFHKDDIGLHSICSGGAMAMILSGVATIIIQRVGRWESLAFLEYIREQVESFTLGVSKKMLQFEEFHHLNEKEYKDKKNECQRGPIQIEKGCVEEIVPFSVHYSSGILINDSWHTDPKSLKLS